MSVTSHKGPGRPKDPAKGEAILQAASLLFLNQGYQGTSMEAVARSAGVSKLTVYSHFNGKEELFAAAIGNVCKSRLPDVLFQPQDHEPLEQRLFIIGEAIFKLTNSPESIALYRLLMGLSTSESDLAERFYEAGPQQVLKGLERLLKHAKQQSLLAITDTTRAAQHFLNLLNGSSHFLLTLGCVSAAPKISEHEHIQEVVALFLNAYRP